MKTILTVVLTFTLSVVRLASIVYVHRTTAATRGFQLYAGVNSGHHRNPLAGNGFFRLIRP